jgi:hypothetical protein
MKKKILFKTHFNMNNISQDKPKKYTMSGKVKVLGNFSYIQHFFPP